MGLDKLCFDSTDESVPPQLLADEAFIEKANNKMESLSDAEKAYIEVEMAAAYIKALKESRAAFADVEVVKDEIVFLLWSVGINFKDDAQPG